MFKVYRSARFDKELEKYGNYFKNRVDKIESELAGNPYSGKPLGVKWFREKRYGKFRIYYLVYEESKAVFMVAISSKKDQEKVINTVKLLLNFFGDELKKLAEVKDD